MTAYLDGLNLNRLVVFVAVAETKSMTQAAMRLGLGKTVVSNHIQRLEQELRASLLARNTRKLELTDAGAEFYESSRLILQHAKEAVGRIQQRAIEAKGTLRVSVPLDFSCAILSPMLVELQKQHPNLHVDLFCKDDNPDVITEGYDAAIRLGDLPDSNLQATKIGSFSLCLTASPTLIKKFTTISHITQVTTLPFISLSSFPSPLCWTFTCQGELPHRVQFTSSLSANTAHNAAMLAVAGGGLTLIPSFAAADYIKTGQLVQVLPEWRLPARDAYIVFPYSRFQSKNMRIFIDALKNYGRRFY